MDTLLSDLPGVIVYLDDVLITGKTNEDHMRSLDTVLTRIQEAGLLLKKEKCLFMEKSVMYLGHTIDANGLHPITEKVEAIKEAPRPKNVSQLKSYLGLITYYGRFLPNISHILFPLYRLLRRNTRWRWAVSEEEAFIKSKKMLLSSNLLVHFDPSLELTLACDASPYGVGAVLAHRTADGVEKPIGFVSRTLTSAEKNYSQLEREGLACIFGLKKFHSYLFGHPFTIYTDNLPIKSLFSEKQAVPLHASGRILRWALTLSNYEYKIEFRPTHKHSNADALSRLPISITDVEETVPTELVLLVEAMEQLPITAESIHEWTRKDPILSRVYKYIQTGWLDKCSKEFEPFSNRKLEFSTLNGCILCGARVLIPPPGRRQLLAELHSGHPGVSRMKSLARMYVYWPNMNEDIERLVKGCTQCQENQSEAQQVPLQPWKWPSRPWTLVHIDYAGPFINTMFLIIVDAFSKWVEIFRTNSSTSVTTIGLLRATFARYGIPQTVVSDNGTTFTSAEFKEFMTSNGITHITTSPYHPQSNGLAEKMVQSFNVGMKKFSEGTIDTKLARFLFSYRVTPHTTTGVSPAELLFGRQLRTQFDLLQPNFNTKVMKIQNEQKKFFDRSTKDREFNINDCVYVRNFSRESPQRWIKGKIVRRFGKVIFSVWLQDVNVCVKRHKNHIRARSTEYIPELEINLPVSDDMNNRLPTHHPQQTERLYPTRNRVPPQRLIEENWNK